MDKNGHLSLKLALEAAKRDLEAEYRRKAGTLDAALAILEEIGPNLQTVDVGKLVPLGVQAPSIEPDVAGEIDAEPDAETITEHKPDSEGEGHEPESLGHHGDGTQGHIWENEPDQEGGLEERFILREQVQQTIKEFRGARFAQRDVTQRLIEKHPDRGVNGNSVSNALAKLAKRGEVKIVKPSHGGSDPALYREVRVSP